MALNTFMNGPLVFVFILLISLCIGSFLNVVIYRMPLMKSLSWPPSSCTYCDTRIRYYDNIPLLSFLFLKGRCRACGVTISRLYFVIELLTLILSVVILWHFGMRWQMLAALLFTWWLIPLAVIDIKHLILPDELTLSLLWLGLLVNYFSCFTTLQDAVLGAMAGYLFLCLVNKLYYLCRGQDGLGQGDWKLFAALGAWFGWQSLLYLLTAAALIGTVYGFTLILNKKANKNTPIPFGCFLTLAGWGYMIIMMH